MTMTIDRIDVLEKTIDTTDAPAELVVIHAPVSPDWSHFEATINVSNAPTAGFWFQEMFAETIELGHNSNAGYWIAEPFDTLKSVVVYRPYSTAHLSYAPNGEGALMDRLSKLEELSNGWLGAGSLAPDPSVIALLRTHPDLVTTSPNRISVLPLRDGSIALQWTVGDDEFVAEIHSDKTLHLIADRVAADDVEEFIIVLAGDPLSAFIATGHVA